MRRLGPDRPRVNRNAVVLAVPSREGLEVARTQIRNYLGWEEVQSQLKGQDVDLIRQATLDANLEAAKKKVPEAVQQSYNIVAAVSNSNEVQAFKMAPGNDQAVVRPDQVRPPFSDSGNGCQLRGVAA